MVCIYCDGSTGVINSRLQKRLNRVWRRRKCINCGAVFSTNEQPEYEQTLAVQSPSGQYSPFLRDKLFLSIYKSCEHRKSATMDAQALTNTIIGKLVKSTDSGKLNNQEIVRTTLEILKNFDRAAMTHYQAFHPRYL